MLLDQVEEAEHLSQGAECLVIVLFILEGRQWTQKKMMTYL